MSSPTSLQHTPPTLEMITLNDEVRQHPLWPTPTVHVQHLQWYSDARLQITPELVEGTHQDANCYFPEKFVGWQFDDNDKLQICVKWWGYDEAANTWTAFSGLLEDLPGKMRAYINSIKHMDARLHKIHFDIQATHDKRDKRQRRKKK